jgi:hypothetical protein
VPFAREDWLGGGARTRGMLRASTNTQHVCDRAEARRVYVYIYIYTYTHVILRARKKSSPGSPPMDLTL